MARCQVSSTGWRRDSAPVLRGEGGDCAPLHKLQLELIDLLHFSEPEKKQKEMF